MMTVPRGTDRPGQGTEDAATVLFETDRGALGSVVVSQVSPGRKNRLWFSLDGALASLQFDQELPDSLWVGGREQNTLVPRGAESSTGDAARYNIVPVGHPQGFLDCFTAFVADVYAATAGGTPDGLPTFDDGLRAAVVTGPVLTSARSGTWVERPAGSPGSCPSPLRGVRGLHGPTPTATHHGDSHFDEGGTTT